MEPNKKIENAAAQAANPAPAQGGNKTLFWILGGCLVLLVIGGLVVGGVAYWSYKKVKNESKMKDAAIIQQQKQLEAAKIEAQKKTEKAPENAPTNIPEEPVSAVDNSGVPSDINPPAASEKAIGYLKKVYSKGGKDYIDIDYVQWLTGDTAEQAMREDGQCPKKGECIVYNDYYIRNQNPLIRTFEVAPDVEIRAHDFEKDYSSGDWTESMTLSRFSQYFNRNLKNGYWDSAPFHIEIGNNKILKITEQYIP